MVIKGVGGSGWVADEVALFGVGVTESVALGVADGVGVAPPGESPNFMVTISRYPGVILIFKDRVRKPLLVTVMA